MKLIDTDTVLAEMDRVVPWKGLVSLIEPHYPKSGKRGHQPMPLESMPRNDVMQQWHAMSDPVMEDALYEIEGTRNRFRHAALRRSSTSAIFHRQGGAHSTLPGGFTGICRCVLGARIGGDRP